VAVLRQVIGVCIFAVLLAAVPAGAAEPDKKPSSGLNGDYYSGTNFGTLKGKHVDPGIDFPDVGKQLARRAGGGSFSVRWSGEFKSLADGFHTFYLHSAGMARLWVDGTLLVDDWRRHDAGEKSGRIRLRGGRWYDIQVDYAWPGGRHRGSVRLSCSAAKVRKAVVPAGSFRPVHDVRDPYPEPYKGSPGFIAAFNGLCWGKNSPNGKVMDLSFEPTFYTLCDLSGYSKPEPRSTALVRAGLAKEKQGEYREAMEKIYQRVIEDHPDDLYRISKYGIYVPVGQYCQRRILRFPRKERAFYRMKRDSRAKREYRQARRKNSLEGLAQIVGSRMATSVGGLATLSLGDSALDRGHYLAALEHYLTVREVFPDRDLHTPELDLKIALCRRMLGDKPGSHKAGKGRDAGSGSRLRPEQLAALRKMVARARSRKSPIRQQRASEPHSSNDDYAFFPPSGDPLGLKPPVWRRPLPGGGSFFSYVQPVATDRSILYRHKNMVFCHSMLTGELRWQNAMGGRVTWQHGGAKQYPQEDLLVQDGLVFSPMHKVGPTLVALDETTGQLKWAYGPMVASTREQASMRFEAAPAGGPRTVYAGYVQDSIEGQAHIDTEYGLIAFESTTGRIRWRRPICRLKPGLFTSGFAVRRRNRIRSFSSPPLYYQGTVYYNTNAGAIAAIDALSGRVKWVMRYPYHSLRGNVHDATRQFNSYLWYNQRPLLQGETLYITPVNSPYLFSLDRRTGRVNWVHRKGTTPHGFIGDETRFSYFMGFSPGGQLVLVHSNRRLHRWRRLQSKGAVQLLDPLSGRPVHEFDDVVIPYTEPIMVAPVTFKYGNSCLSYPRWTYYTAARPFMSSDGKLVVTNFARSMWPCRGGWTANLRVLDLNSRKIVDGRRYASGEVVAFAQRMIREAAPPCLAALKKVRHKNKELKAQIAWCEKIVKDTGPQNEHGGFTPFSRMTFRRYGVLFELRTSGRDLTMVYDREAVKRAVASRDDPDGLFARAELAVGESRLRDAAGLMQRCLATISSEDTDFRSIVNQQLYKVHRRLARSEVRAGRSREELVQCSGMRRTVNTLDEEIETLFALAEAYERRGDLDTSSHLLRSIISTYGHYRYPTPSLLAGDLDKLGKTSAAVFARAQKFTRGTLYGREFARAAELMKRGMPLYYGALSPLEKDLVAGAGELAAARLMAMRRKSPEFAARLEKQATAVLGGKDGAQQLYRLWEFPATRTAQGILDRLFAKAAVAGGSKAEQAGRRKRLWQLADAARICGLKVPAAHRGLVLAPPRPAGGKSLSLPVKERRTDLSDRDGTQWLVCERRGQTKTRPELAFLAGRVKKKFDNKFVLRCLDLTSGKALWDASEQRGEGWFKELRLKGKGNEPGFFEAWLHGDVVVVHGLFDVLAFRISDGKLKWRYRVPFDFEIKEAVSSGDLLILAGKAETLALYMPTNDPRGEIVWQEKEEGDVYIAPYFHKDLLVSVRKLPFSLTVRYRATGKLIGRLQLPDLSLNTRHPLLEKGPRSYPAAHDGGLLVVSDGWYYIAVDVEKMKVVWKRLIDNSDPTSEPTMRFCLKGEYLAVVKVDFDWKSIYMLSSRTGSLMWRTDPKNASSPRPVHSMMIEGDTLYGIKIHPGQGFYFAAMDCKTGKGRYRFNEQKGYAGKPSVGLFPRLYGECAVARIRDRQNFELKAFDVSKGKLVGTIKVKGTGDFREHGRASAAVQSGALLLLGKKELVATPGAK